MNSKAILAGFVIISSVISLCSCVPEEIVLHGHIAGVITDAETNWPIGSATVKLVQSNATLDTTITGNDGSYVLRNLEEGSYEVEASKFAFSPGKKEASAIAASTKIVDIALNGIAVPGISESYYDFGLEATSFSFIISNLGKGTFTYYITKYQDWITVTPSSGEISNENDTINVTINRNGLPDKYFKELLEVVSTGNGILTKDNINLYINGVVDQDGNGYRVVKIGTQTWMAENLNVGQFVLLQYGQKNDHLTEKYCYDDVKENCDTYGGLYRWDEMMQYNPSDTGVIGITQGICPDGWHLPTKKEWETLIEFLGEILKAGGKLKETGTDHWDSPNVGASNESGFSAYPGGTKSWDDYYGGGFQSLGSAGHFWSSSWLENVFFYDVYIDHYYKIQLSAGDTAAYDSPNTSSTIDSGNSVRCVKNPDEN